VPTIVIVGAGIGGLSLALALARRGIASSVLEQAEQLEQTGAGIQLSPNATRILLDLGLGDLLRASAVTPEAVRVVSAKGREILRVPLGSVAEERYGAPYYVLHRADLQSALLAASQTMPAITLRLGVRVQDYAVTPSGITLRCRTGGELIEVQASSLVGADGLWSSVRAQIDPAPPRFARRSAWRALIPAQQAPAEFRAPLVHLWLGRDDHLVHYPVSAGAMINIVAIVNDCWKQEGWTAIGQPDALLARLRPADWHASARALLGVPDHWQKWALYDHAPLQGPLSGPVTLLGDAAHPVLPFLAQGAALAIEDAWILAEAIAASPDDLASAMRVFEAHRYARTCRVQRAARANGAIYHLSGLAGFGRDKVMRLLGGARLLSRYDWLYGWKPSTPGGRTNPAAPPSRTRAKRSEAVR
jgi:salicylate hydroxylase